MPQLAYSSTTLAVRHCENWPILRQDPYTFQALADSSLLIAAPSAPMAEPCLEHTAHHHGRELAAESLLDVLPGPQVVHGSQNALRLGAGR